MHSLAALSVFAGGAAAHAAGRAAYRLDGALHIDGVQSSARAKRRHVDVAGQVSAQSAALSPAACDIPAGAGRHCAVERGEGLRHGCAAEDPGRIRRICVGRSRLLRKLWADMVYVCVYGDLAARSFMCKGEALLRLTMRCQCYAERDRQLKVADRLVHGGLRAKHCGAPSRRNLRFGRRGAAEHCERGPYVSNEHHTSAVASEEVGKM